MEQFDGAIGTSASHVLVTGKEAMCHTPFYTNALLEVPFVIEETQQPRLGQCVGVAG